MKLSFRVVAATVSCLCLAFFARHVSGETTTVGQVMSQACPEASTADERAGKLPQNDRKTHETYRQVASLYHECAQRLPKPSYQRDLATLFYVYSLYLSAGAEDDKRRRSLNAQQVASSVASASTSDPWLRDFAAQLREMLKSDDEDAYEAAHPKPTPTPASDCASVGKVLSRERSALLALENTGYDSDRSSQIDTDLTLLLPSDDKLKQCGKQMLFEKEVLQDWSSALYLRHEVEGDHGTPDCSSAVYAHDRLLVAGIVRVWAGMRLELLPDRIDNRPDFVHVHEILRKLENQYGMSDEPESPSASVASIESYDDLVDYENHYHDEYLRAAAAAPDKCTPPPSDYADSIRAAGEGPSLIKTDAWLTENLPTEHFGIDGSLSTHQTASYYVDGCSIKVKIATDLAKTPTPTSPVTPSPLYVIEVEAASNSRHGGRVYFGEGGEGSVEFSDVQPRTIIVKTDTEPSLWAMGLGFKTFDLAFSDEDKAQRVAAALKRLATLCGAKDDPF